MSSGKSALRFPEWRTRFRQFTAGRRTSTALLSRLRKSGCSIEVLEQLLYAVVFEGRKPLAQFKQPYRKFMGEVRSLLSELQDIIPKIRGLSWLYVERDWQDSERIFRNSQRQERLMEFRRLPETLLSYRRHVEDLAASLEVKNMDDHGPHLAIVAAYVKVKAGRARYDDLRLLLDDAHRCVGHNFTLSTEALRKSLDRYKRTHPKTSAAIVSSITNYESQTFPTRSTLLAYVLADLEPPPILSDQ